MKLTITRVLSNQTNNCSSRILIMRIFDFCDLSRSRDICTYSYILNRFSHRKADDIYRRKRRLQRSASILRLRFIFKTHR